MFCPRWPRIASRLPLRLAAAPPARGSKRVLACPDAVPIRTSHLQCQRRLRSRLAEALLLQLAMSLNESAEISALLRESTLTGPSSTQLGWSGVAVERRTIQPCEKPELPIDHHFLLLWLDPVSEGEIERKPGRFVPYKKV